MEIENVIDAMNRISENIVLSKLIYRNKTRRKELTTQRCDSIIEL